MPTPPELPAPRPDHVGGASAHSDVEISIDRKLARLVRRLLAEATAAVGMLEAALEALWNRDMDAAQEIRRRDDAIDIAEVEIEEECARLLALQHPFGRDLRTILFCLKANVAIERVADHAVSIARVIRRLGDAPVEWPIALQELGQRVPIRCHTLLRAVMDEDVEAARRAVAEDEQFDQLDKQLFTEVAEMIEREPSRAAAGLLVYRAGRELERVGDLMAGIAEEVVYLRTGEIIRHEKHGQG